MKHDGEVWIVGSSVAAGQTLLNEGLWQEISVHGPKVSHMMVKYLPRP